MSIKAPLRSGARLSFNLITMKKILLIIEDDPTLRSLLADAFIHEPLEILTASDGQEGLEKAQHEHPDLILLDITLPKMDGITLLDTLRKNPDDARIPVVILTNDVAMDHVWEGVSLGAYQYLVKANSDIPHIVDVVKQQLTELEAKTASNPTNEPK